MLSEVCCCLHRFDCGQCCCHDSFCPCGPDAVLLAVGCVVMLQDAWFDSGYMHCRVWKKYRHFFGLSGRRFFFAPCVRLYSACRFGPTVDMLYRGRCGPASRSTEIWTFLEDDVRYAAWFNSGYTRPLRGWEVASCRQQTGVPASALRHWTIGCSISNHRSQVLLSHFGATVVSLLRRLHTLWPCTTS